MAEPSLAQTVRSDSGVGAGNESAPALAESGPSGSGLTFPAPPALQSPELGRDPDQDQQQQQPEAEHGEAIQDSEEATLRWKVQQQPRRLARVLDDTQDMIDKDGYPRVISCLYKVDRCCSRIRVLLDLIRLFNFDEALLGFYLTLSFPAAKHVASNVVSKALGF